MGQQWDYDPPITPQFGENVWLLIGLVLCTVGLAVAAVVGMHRQCQTLHDQGNTRAQISHGCSQ